MNFIRRYFLAGLPVGVALLAGCEALAPKVDVQIRQALAPAGRLRVAVFPGSALSTVVVSNSGEKTCVALATGRELARQLGVEMETMEFQRLSEVLHALKTSHADFALLNQAAVRAWEMDITGPLLGLELGYLVRGKGPLHGVSDVDRAGRRVGVSEGSGMQRVQTALLKRATVVTVASLAQVGKMLEQNKLDAYATHKDTLYKLADKFKDLRVLEGRWGVEQQVIAIPKGRDGGMNFLRQFTLEAGSSAWLESAVAKAGVRGTVKQA